MPKKKLSTEPAATSPTETAKPAKLTAQDLRRLIAERHDIHAAGDKRTGLSLEWALFFELRNGTGHGRQDRYVDAFAFNLYPSKKHWRVAYEIKVSRSDFLSELKKPEKRAFGFEISNEFWYVCTPGVAKPEEIPEGCGLLVVQGGKLKRVVQALQREARDMTMSEMASIARSSCRYDVLTSRLWRYQDCELDEYALNALVAARKDAEFRAEVERQVEAEVKARTQHLRENVDAYAKAMRDAGVEPPAWMQPEAESFFRGWGSRNAADWVRDNVKPGPNLKEVAKAMAQLQEFQRTVDRLSSRMQGSLTELAEAGQAAMAEVKKLS